MSAGEFQIARYAATYNPAAIHPIRIQPETLTLSVTIAGAAVANTQAAGALTTPTSAVVSRGARSRGLRARLIRIRFTGEPPEGYKQGGIITLPALNPALLSAPEGATGTYRALPIVVVGTSPERAR